MTPAQRLREWSECAGAEPSFWQDENVLHRMIRGDIGSGRPPGNGPIPGFVDRHSIAMAQYRRVLEVQRVVDGMREDYRQVVRIEFVEGKGWRQASRELEWTQRKWYTTRNRMLGYMEARLENSPQKTT